ncbi:glycine cleavage system aminomethyltransferase GcvT [Micrococcus sp. EYE_162]|uniref:glycine cleavage system aminomethyltransferase GcvT n=1 Tax=unclassified Micrococcus TaxID=2620948 RepID=UPI002005FABE|nr:MULTISPECIES: glycine cleavage system aminomethyltransferase GcvT [unclassified Micrococcus]MCK6095482.1 glycine cleavage system aminomethyltransferase GcvT [Micrococcus sp. EYE_212]MCK6171557.1 glycine cleavage system aminomethyltransferase GcvT [Micrococcus sp. EYE_162]
MTDSLRNSPLHPVHEAAGASFTDFGGWNMPLKYGSELAEHKAVRGSAGLFDLSHMGEVRVSGPEAGAMLDHALSSTLSVLKPGRAKYALCLTDAGTILDDLIVYRRDDGAAGSEPDFLVVPNAGNIAAVHTALNQRASGWDATVEDESASTAVVAVQGPCAEAILAHAMPAQAEQLAGLKYYGHLTLSLPTDAGEVTVLVARTGYTGEDGFELFVPADSRQEAGDRGSAVWNAMLQAAEAADVELTPCGLASRDSLRLEAGMPLYGNELDTAHQPHASGVSFAVPAAKEADFVGKAALVGADGVQEVLVGLRGEGRRAARHGYPVLDAEGNRVGEVTSGAPSPTLGFPIAMARVAREHAAEGTSLQVDLRGKGEPFTVVPLPFYRRER